jgi:hypothetical protein
MRNEKEAPVALERNRNASEFHTARKRVSVPRDLIRRLGGALAYGAIEAFGPDAQSELSKVFDLGGVIDLILLCQLPEMEIAPGVEQ